MKTFWFGGRMRFSGHGVLAMAFGVVAILVFLTVCSRSAAAIAPNINDVPRWENNTTIDVGGRKFQYDTGVTDKWVFKYSELYPIGVNLMGSCVSTITFSTSPYANDGGQQAERVFKHVSNLNPDGTVTPNQQCTTYDGSSGTVRIENASAVNANKEDGDPSAPLTPTEEAAEERTKCDAIGYNPLKWFVCPVVNGAFELIEVLDEAINTLLTINIDRVFDTSTTPGKSYYSVWSTFRGLALGFVVIAALVVLIASAFGLEVLDAYTFRVALPRVFIAVIGIALSWEILEFLIMFTNDVGNGVRSMIYAPFRNDLAGASLGNGSLFVGNLLFGGGAISLGFIGLLSFGATAAIAVAIAFFILVLREMIVVLLVLVAPIAIAAIILPNTRKIWQLWQNTLTSMLVVFPIISAFIALGRVFALVASQGAQATGAVNSTINEIIAFIAYFAPYFMMPFAFKMAGGMLATISGMANDSNRGAFDRLKKFRQGKQAENMGKLKAGNRFSEHGGRFMSAPTRAFNRATVGASTGFKGRYGIGKRGAEAVDTKRRMATAELMKSAEWQAGQDDDDARMAQTFGSAAQARTGLHQVYRNRGYTEERATQETERAIRAVNASTGFGQPQQIAAAQQLGATGTGYKNMDEMTSAIARASGGNESSAASMAGYLNFINKQKGRHDLAPGAGNVIADAHRKMGQMKRGEAVTDNSRILTQSAWNSGSMYQLANGKKQAMLNFAEHHLANLNSGDRQAREDAAIALMEMQNMLPSATGDNQQVIQDTMRRAGLDYTAGESTLDRQIAARINGGIQAGDPSEISINALRLKARVYDREAMDQMARGGP